MVLEKKRKEKKLKNIIFHILYMENNILKNIISIIDNPKEYNINTNLQAHEKAYLLKLFSNNDDIITESTNKEDEDTEKFDKVEYFIKKATKLINKMKFPAVKRIGFDYDEMMNGYHVNIFFDRQFAIDNPKGFNKVKQNSLKEIGSTITSYFPFKFYFYIHYE